METSPNNIPIDPLIAQTFFVRQHEIKKEKEARRQARIKDALVYQPVKKGLPPFDWDKQSFRDEVNASDGKSAPVRKLPRLSDLITLEDQADIVTLENVMLQPDEKPDNVHEFTPKPQPEVVEETERVA